MEALVNATRVVELRATTRDESIAELVAASGCTDWGISAEELIAAVQEREATAQTVVANDLAIPHASVDWDGDFTVVFGRSRRGVQFGAGDTQVQLVVLLITGKRQSARHVQVLAALAELIKETDFRRTLIEASGAKTLLRLLQERAGIVASASTLKPQLSVRSLRLTEQAVQLAQALEVQAILLAVDRLSNVPWNTLAEWPGRILIVATHVQDEELPDRKKTRVFEVPHAGLSRIDRANLGMLLAASSGLLTDESDVVCVTGPPGMSSDCIAIIRPADKFHSVFQGNIEKGTARIPPAVILRVISLAIEISSEGREGKAIGTMFVLGDTRQVQRRARQLVLNPFHGFSRRIRNVLDPGLSETVKEYASLDGAFIIGADGTMLSAGTYLVPEKSSGDLPGGLGARHQAAASITAQTKAMAVVVSQSTGKISILQNGSSILSLERSSLTRW
jgi:DNA integrity scanning protein DisA with diadenylate cyclase activity/mannitol/fructose-specific phosphotransferase system IIA component (Ntr-type)